jgi:hypothetical protein
VQLLAPFTHVICEGTASHAVPMHQPTPTEAFVAAAPPVDRPAQQPAARTGKAGTARGAD